MDLGSNWTFQNLLPLDIFIVIDRFIVRTILPKGIGHFSQLPQGDYIKPGMTLNTMFLKNGKYFQLTRSVLLLADSRNVKIGNIRGYNLYTSNYNSHNTLVSL